MPNISSEQLSAYLDDALNSSETAEIEKALRDSDALRRQLRALMQQLDRGEHSVGAIWRRYRLSCPTREQLGSFLLGVLDPEHADYIQFHLHTTGCSFCLANFADLQAQQQEPADKTRKRRKRLFETSAGYLSVCQDK